MSYNERLRIPNPRSTATVAELESNGTDPIKHNSTSTAARYSGVTKQTLDYAYRNRRTRIVRRKGGVKEVRITWLD